MTPLQYQLHNLKSELPDGVRLVAVSKFHPLEKMKEAYDAGQRIFGESRVQELQQKQPNMPADVEWHFIGHLQANKVKYIVPYVSLIHAVDSEKLLQEIDRQAEKSDRRVRCLMQVHVAEEATKFGFSPEEYRSFFEAERWKAFPHVQLSGLMCMATNTDDSAQIRREFHLAHTLFQWTKDRFFSHDEGFCECSWGMSDDYPLAIAEGSTLVRVGSKIFGNRA